MEASKLTINPDHLRFQPLPAAKKTELRRKNILDLIRNTPNGTKLRLVDFQKAGAYKTTASAWGMVSTLLKHGTIVREREGLSGYSYYVAADAVKKQLKPAAAAPADQAAEQPKFSFTTTKVGEFEQAAQGYINQLAKQYAWEYNSDSLREFVKWLGIK
jgi:hypothetical protein